MRYVLHKLPYPNRDPAVARAPDPLIVGSARDVYEAGEIDPEPMDILRVLGS
jgi:hypothetical protein